MRQIAPTEAVPTVYHIVQDPAGFMWLGSGGGLLRYDGEDIVRWRPDVISRVIERMVVGADGTVYVSEQSGGLFRVRGTDAVELMGPTGAPLAHIRDIAVDDKGTLWLALSDGVFRTDDGVHWREAFADSLEQDPRVLLPTPEGMVIGTRSAIWRAQGQEVERLFDLQLPKWLARTSDGVLWIATWNDGVWRTGPGAPTRVFERGAIRIVARGDTLWMTQGDELVRARGDEVERMGAADGFPQGRALGVDAEGGLWLGGKYGLFHYPAVDTVMWSRPDGMPLPAGRTLARTAEGMWVSTWGGLGRVNPDGSVYSESEFIVRNQVCADAGGTLWTMPNREIAERLDGAFVRYPMDVGGTARCTPNRIDGGLWITRGGRLFRTAPSGGPPTRVDGPFADAADEHEAVFHDRTGRLWVARDSDVCHTDAAAPGAWQCSAIDVRMGGVIMDINETAEGDVWMSVRGEGVLRFDGATWQVMPASQRVPSRWIRTLRPSPRGGAWVLGQDFALRAVADGDDWRIVEDLSWRHGLLNPGSEDLFEEADGTLWLANQASTVARVPASVRFAPLPPPRVIAARAEGDGAALGLEQTASLPADTERVNVTFRALTYREPSRVRYRVRVGNGAWSDARDDATFMYLQPGAGAYDVQAVASLDGQAWSDTPARVRFAVQRAWYWQWWAWTLGFAVLLALLYLAHRARLAMQLRLERQRLRIAMDLHDDVGSGLGSISVLAGVAAESDGDQRALAARIADTATDLGDALGSIVWSLREGAAALEPLMTHLVARAESLVADGRASVRADVPSPFPEVPLTLPVVRNLQLIGQEALHNAARHSGCAHIELALRKSGGAWTLSVTDDGCGIAADSEPGGLGLSSMRRRAEDIGARLAIDAGPDGAGTRVSVTFAPDASDARVAERTRGLPRASTR